MNWLAVYIFLGWIIRLAMIPIVLRRQFTTGASLAWLSIIFFHPYIGGALYVLIGESRLGRQRLDLRRELVSRRRANSSPALVAGGGDSALRPELDPLYGTMVLQASHMTGLPMVGAEDVEFIGDTAAFIERLSSEIDAARSRVHLLYFIFAPDESGRRVSAALTRAARRGVKCRVLADGVGSRKLLHHHGLGRELSEAGVQMVEALPVAPIRRRFARMDMRNHRKLALLDANAAYVGSHNLINADYGGRRGGPWHDLTARLSGPVVSQLELVFADDWAMETGESIEPAQNVKPSASADPSAGTAMNVAAQVLPTGPGAIGQSFRRALLAALHCARKQVILTTPYFVPDESTLLALMMAADRGVDVKLIVPLRPDHFFTAAAARAQFQSLLDAGVAVHLYRPGLVHAKTTTVDDAIAIVGSANLDVRSFMLNFELSVVLYGPQITQRLRTIQLSYLADSTPIDPVAWSRRAVVKRYAERGVALLSPLL